MKSLKTFLFYFLIEAKPINLYSPLWFRNHRPCKEPSQARATLLPRFGRWTERWVLGRRGAQINQKPAKPGIQERITLILLCKFWPEDLEYVSPKIHGPVHTQTHTHTPELSAHRIIIITIYDSGKCWMLN